MTAKLKPFEVVRTPKIKDSRNQYCKMGEICYLTKEMAEHYHKLGYIRVKMDNLFNDDDDDDNGADGAPTDSGPDDAEPDLEAGAADEGTSGADAQDDAGTGASEGGSGRIANRRRKRASS